jgi:predicted lactoylglutathione lyase
MPSKSPKIFINLPVKDLSAAISFYTTIGLVENKKYADATMMMMCLAPPANSEVSTVNVMLITHERFKSLIPSDRNICDAKSVTEVRLCLSADSRDAVDEMVANAEKAGGKPDVCLKQDTEGMHGRSFADLDGHVWEMGWVAEMAAEH